MRMAHVVIVRLCFIWTCSTCVSARFSVLTQEPPVVTIGDNAFISCRTSVTGELMEVRWIRNKDGNYSTINFFQDGKDQQRCELPEYVGRTEPVTKGFSRGRATLKLFNVSVDDEGLFRCLLETKDYFDFADLELKVTALGSEPRIDIERFQDGGITLVCRSAGWYPEPTLEIKKADGKMKIQKEENGLYSIEYSRVISENSNRTFSCPIWGLFPDEHREALLNVTDDLFQRTADCIPRSRMYPLVAVLLFLLLLLLIITTWACRIKKRDTRYPGILERCTTSYPEVLMITTTGRSPV